MYKQYCQKLGNGDVYLNLLKSINLQFNFHVNGLYILFADAGLFSSSFSFHCFTDWQLGANEAFENNEIKSAFVKVTLQNET